MAFCLLIKFDREKMDFYKIHEICYQNDNVGVEIFPIDVLFLNQNIGIGIVLTESADFENVNLMINFLISKGGNVTELQSGVKLGKNDLLKFL